ncbi:MAG: NAD-dependent epimerase/dehydratase family protein [Flavisolibacter sp.]
MTISLTGASGFVGRNLQPYLEKAGFEVMPVKRTVAGFDFSAIDESTSAFIHLAGKAHDLKNVSNTEDYFRANTELTRQLYNVFLASHAEVFVFMSSVKAAADRVEGVLTEDDRTDPQTAYGKSKRAAEEYILAHLPENKKVYILRPCMIHGPGNKGNLNLLYKLVSKGIPWPLAGFENKRSFCSVDNLCFVIKELLGNASIPSGIYNVADDEAVSTNELISLIAASQNRKARLLRVPKGIIQSISKIGDVMKLPLNSERLQKLTESYVVSNEKIKKAIGKPLPVSAANGLKMTLQSFRKT